MKRGKGKLIKLFLLPLPIGIVQSGGRDGADVRGQADDPAGRGRHDAHLPLLDHGGPEAVYLLVQKRCQGAGQRKVPGESEFEL